MEVKHEFDYEKARATLLEHHPNPEYAKMISDAFDYCINSHRNADGTPILRKTGEPFDQHPISVALILNDVKADYETISAALLHDTIEDVDGITKETIEEKFSANIATLVDGVTKISQKDFENKLVQSYLTLIKLIRTVKIDPRVVLVKLADRLHNMRTVHGHKPEKQIAYAKETMNVYVRIANIYGWSKIKQELEQLAFPLAESASFENISKDLLRKVYQNPDLIDFIQNGNNIIMDKLSSKNLAVVSSTFRTLNAAEISEEFSDLGIKEVLGLNDLLRFKVTFESEDDVFLGLRVLNQMFPPIHGTGFGCEDYINSPYSYFERFVESYNSLGNFVTPSKFYPIYFRLFSEELLRIEKNGITSYFDYDNNVINIKDIMKDVLTKECAPFKAVMEKCDEYEKRIQGRKTNGEISVTHDDLVFGTEIDQLLLTRKIVIYYKDGRPMQINAGTPIKNVASNLFGIVPDTTTIYRVNNVIVGPGRTLQNGDIIDISRSKGYPSTYQRTREENKN